MFDKSNLILDEATSPCQCFLGKGGDGGGSLLSTRASASASSSEFCLSSFDSSDAPVKVKADLLFIEKRLFRRVQRFTRPGRRRKIQRHRHGCPLSSSERGWKGHGLAGPIGRLEGGLQEGCRAGTSRLQFCLMVWAMETFASATAEHLRRDSQRWTSEKFPLTRRPWIFFSRPIPRRSGSGPT